MTSAMVGVMARLTDGMKNDAGILFASSSLTMRSRPTRAPYCACDSAPTVGSPKRMGIVSLSTSNESNTATRALPGHFAGLSDRPALTALMTVYTLSMDHFQPGFAVVGGTGCAWANTQAGMRASTSERMAQHYGDWIGASSRRLRLNPRSVRFSDRYAWRGTRGRCWPPCRPRPVERSYLSSP